MTLTLSEGWRGFAHFQLESRRKVLRKCADKRTFNELYILDELALNVKFLRNLPFSKRLEVCKLFKYLQAESNSVVYKIGDLATSLYIIFTGSVKCELVLLNKEDLSCILNNDVSQEVKDKMETLKYVKALRGISDHSIRRLAKLLVPRTYAKNRVISFQGEEAMEMYFMRSGECRIVMEVCKEPRSAPRPLPQAALRSCRFPSLSSKACPYGFDWRYEAGPYIGGSMGSLSNDAVGSRSGYRQDAFSPIERPSPQFSEYHTFSNDGSQMGRSSQQARRDQRTSSCLSFTSVGTVSDLEMKGIRKGNRHCGQTMHRSRTVKNRNGSYTLKSFLKDFEKRDSGEDHIPDLAFSDKHALIWNTGTNLTGMLRGDIGDSMSYQKKFENWARKVITREKRMRAEAAIDVEFASNISKDFLLNSWPPEGSRKSDNSKDTVFLDIGALHPGDYFGEVGILHHSQRKASILTVTAAEVLVLSKWDFNRQLDRDVVERLSANDYKNIDHIYHQYQKTLRWAQYKKKLINEVLAARRQRFPNLYEHDMCRGSLCTKYPKRE
ncbi:hypothetical protein KP509_05G011500 [Ceratopteris richardii]|uniref:Cyclic nucleotide-binding domain-containing protein n=1 Tax=Ceratopteris richardii TaxID=49495 RepID=A0A8T2USC2_CERRI|nr:hypothetical protein KP509_05G011500 [Ceratopteris richardii]KAH7436284.1 hypothetical protein KP509_05G011500 [Ceratopteris richardii]